MTPPSLHAVRAGAAALLVVLGGLCLGACGSDPPPSALSVFPVPGSRVAAPQAQITFRGEPISKLGSITVAGSKTGRHGGRLEADSDNRGGSFLPSKPFAAGETVTVHVKATVHGVKKGTFHFTVATPAGAITPVPVPTPARVPGDVWQFHSRPDLSPASVEIVKQSPQADTGDIFVAPQAGPVQNGVEILGPQGSLVWFHPTPKGDEASDFRVQNYGGKPVLTWWQGFLGTGIGVGEDLIDDSSYRQIAVVKAGNGLAADLHEFQLTSAGTALITAYYPVYWDTSSIKGGPTRAVVLDGVAQEIDVKTGLVLFQWDSLDHVPVSDSEVPLPATAKDPFDYFHINSVQQEQDGNLIVSARNTWAAYKVGRQTGGVIWRLGGKHSSFKLDKSAAFAFQHDVRIRGSGDHDVTLFDDGAGPPTVHKQSRGLELTLSSTKHTATTSAQRVHSPPLLANFEGNVQRLTNGDDFLGWGQQPYFTEFDGSGQTVFDGRFVSADTSYRAYRFPWSATPVTAPKLAVTHAGGNATVYASWNGATNVSSWRVLAGQQTSSLQSVATAQKVSFETQATVSAAPYIAVQALDASGKVLGTSAPAAGQ